MVVALLVLFGSVSVDKSPIHLSWSNLFMTIESAEKGELIG